MAEANYAAGTAPHYICRIDNDPEEAPHAWPTAFEVRDVLGRRAIGPGNNFSSYFGHRGDDPRIERNQLARAEDARAKADWHANLPRGQRAGAWLEVARTVRSRALDALSRVSRDGDGLPWSGDYTVEELDIIADLEAVVSKLDRWQRTGKTPKYTNPKAGNE